jgi:hypothetical protein
MTSGVPVDWLAAFPLEQATQAVEALSGTWNLLAHRHRDGFHRAKKEPDLTLVLCSRVRDLHPRMLGHWSAEPVTVKVDPNSLVIESRTRTDIEYTWNDSRNWRIIFEFKKLKKTSRSRREYLGGNGLRRFVDGAYSSGDPVACMVGIVIEDYQLCVTPIETALNGDAALRASLRISAAGSGGYLQTPSIVFPAHAAFDTIHTRPADRAPSHGSIHVPHLFLEFGYPVVVPKRRARKRT